MDLPIPIPASPHSARPLLLAGAGHTGMEFGAGVQGGLLPKALPCVFGGMGGGETKGTR